MRTFVPPLPPEPLPFSVLTGFLGSGKTTLLRRLLANPAFTDTAVVVNEFGAVGLDHLLLEAVGPEAVVLPNGCVCCAVRQDLAETLYGLLRRRAAGDLPAFRRMVLETSGLAEPAPILYTLSADAFLEQALRLDSVTTTVDTIAGAATLDQFAEAMAQAACADRLLLTKTDLALADSALVDRLTALNPAAAIDDAASVMPEAVLFSGGREASPPRGRFVATAGHAHNISSFVVEFRQPMSRLQFATALGGLAREHGQDLLRVKGIVGFADRAEGPAAIHAVQHTMYPPRWLSAWPEADRTSRMVFIVRGIAPAIVLECFAAGNPVLMDAGRGGG